MAFEFITNIFSGEFALILTIAFFTTVIVIYSIFVFYFYRFLAKRNIMELNLSQYNNYSNPAAVKFFAAIFYILEYIVLLPIITFFWFAILSILVLILSKNLDTATILLISAALVSAVRITSYISQDLSRDLAKMLPFTLLAIAITTAGFFNISALLDRATEIPSLFPTIPYYLLFIVGIEVVMRVVEFFEKLMRYSEAEE